MPPPAPCAGSRARTSDGPKGYDWPPPSPDPRASKSNPRPHRGRRRPLRPPPGRRPTRDGWPTAGRRPRGGTGTAADLRFDPAPLVSAVTELRPAPNASPLPPSSKLTAPTEAAVAAAFEATPRPWPTARTTARPREEAGRYFGRLAYLLKRGRRRRPEHRPRPGTLQPSSPRAPTWPPPGGTATMPCTGLRLAVADLELERTRLVQGPAGPGDREGDRPMVAEAEPTEPRTRPTRSRPEA